MVEDTWTVEEDVRREEVDVDEGRTGLRLGRSARLESPIGLFPYGRWLSRMWGPSS